MEDGGWMLEGGRWKMEDGGWKMMGRRWRMKDGAWLEVGMAQTYLPFRKEDLAPMPRLLPSASPKAAHL